MNAMILKRSFLLVLCFCWITLAEDVTVIEKVDEDVFPADFSFGVATAAYQIEGGWNADGKGPSIWDTFTHNHPEMIADRSNGDVGPDSYNLFEEDLAALKELGVNHYRFSIAWSRVLPSGDKSSLNTHGIAYYNTVINKLLENNIKPMVTMYHYDLPEELQKIGGLANPLFIKYFREYADVLYSNFGDRVKVWITFNEPADFCIPGYGLDIYPPQANASGIGEYLCMHHVIKSHTLAYRLYKEKYREEQRGKVGMTVSSRFLYSKNEDMEAVDRSMQFGLGWSTHAIFSKTGGYPQIMEKIIEENSKKEGRTWSRLPMFDAHWKNLIKGSSDFLGINYYTSRFVESTNSPSGRNPSIQRDESLNYYTDPKWKRAKSSWLYSVPQGLGDLLRWIKENYNNVEVIVTENGWSDNGGLADDDRIDYLKSHVKEVLNAIQSGCNVKGYTFWSLIDNFEWDRGYTEKFGLYAINYTSALKERIPRKSVQVYKSIIENRRVNL